MASASVDFAKRPGSFNSNKRKATHLMDRRFVPRVTEFVQVCANKPTVDEIIDYLQESFHDYSRRKRGALRQYVIKALEHNAKNTSKATQLENSYMERRQKRSRSEEDVDIEDEEELCNESDTSYDDEEELVDYKDTNLINNSLKNLYKNVANNKDKVTPTPQAVIDLTDNNTKVCSSSKAVPQSQRRKDLQRSPSKSINTLHSVVHPSPRRQSSQTISKNDEPLSPWQQVEGSQSCNMAGTQSVLQVFSKSNPAKGPPAKSKINIHASLLDERTHNRVPLENDSCLEPEDLGLTSGGNGNHVSKSNDEEVSMKSEIVSPTEIPLTDDTNARIPINNKNLTSIPREERKSSSRPSTPIDKGKNAKKKAEHAKEVKKRFEPVVSTKTFKDVGGYQSCIQEVSKLLLHLKHPEVFTTIGIKPPRGFLLHGPPGCGKTLLANAIAGELAIPFFNVSAPEIVSGISGDSEQRVRSLFAEALAIAPSILFIDEIDSITPKREEAGKEMERRIVTQILTCMDNLAESDSHVLVIGATNRPDSLDPALRRAGRFDREIAMGIPDRSSRKTILKVICSGLRLSPDFDFDAIAMKTPGYVGADMEALKREAAICAVDSVFKLLEEQRDHFSITRPTTKTCGETSSYKDTDSTAWLRDEPPLSQDQLESLFISTQHFENALPHVQPSAKREGFATVPDVTWDDIGALEDIREELSMAIMAPVQNPEEFESLGLTTPPGILLCGPPGCGKTLLAKAVANEAGINFISVKGPELLNMYVGESEKAVRQVFQRARSSSPCVIFFDEIDALCPQRSRSGDSSVTSRVVNQLLTEMDGLESRKSVFIMGATNRPDILDRAILRPGRMDKQLHVGLPNSMDRCKILRTITKNGTKPSFSPNISIEELASDEKCEGFSGADLSALVREASIAALKDFMKNGNNMDNEEIHVDKEVPKLSSDSGVKANKVTLETIDSCQSEPSCEQSQTNVVMEDNSSVCANDEIMVQKKSSSNLSMGNGIHVDEPSINNACSEKVSIVSENSLLQSPATPIVEVTETVRSEEKNEKPSETKDLIPKLNCPTTADVQVSPIADEKTKAIIDIGEVISLNADSPAITDFKVELVTEEVVKEFVKKLNSGATNDASPVPELIDSSIEEIIDPTCEMNIDIRCNESSTKTPTDDLNNMHNQMPDIVNAIPLSTIIAGPSQKRKKKKKIVVYKRHFILAFQKVQASVSETDRDWYEKMKSGRLR